MNKEDKLKKLTAQTELPNFWNDNLKAQSIMKKISDIGDEIEKLSTLKKSCHDALELAKLGDNSIRPDLETESARIENILEKLELNISLSGPYDKGNTLLSINAGAGGTDAQDWAAMLQRMYLRWAEKKGYKSEIVNLSEGEEAGIKSITALISGKYAYGYLRSEKGVHRLVRLSPFDAAHRRHTSFAQVDVLPEVAAEDPTVEINPNDLQIDVFKSAGAGGQNVQKNETAIRITHKPTGIVVICQNERSQLQNRENAMKVLRGRLYAIKLDEQEKKMTELRGEYQKAEWGSQIRSYILHPYKRVKDHRTNLEVGNTQAVLDGDIDKFIEAYLMNKQKLTK